MKVLVVAIFAIFSNYLEAQAAACQQLVEQLSSAFISLQHGLLPHHRKFIEDYLLPFFGERTLLQADLDGNILPRLCQSTGENSFIIKFSDGPLAAGHLVKDLLFQWEENLLAPAALVTETHYIIKLPTKMELSSLGNQGRDFLYRSLVGHHLHPFLEDREILRQRKLLKLPQYQLKQVQQDVLDLIDQLHQRADRQFLIVAPTATGKTIMLRGLFAKQVAKYQGQKIVHFLFSHRTDLTQQLYRQMLLLPDTAPVEVVLLGAGSNQHLMNLAQVEKKLQQAFIEGKQLLVVANTQQIVNHLRTVNKTFGPIDGAIAPNHFASLIPFIGTFAFDEAHHMGAEQTMPIIQDLTARNSHFLLAGTTATPIHQETSILHLFEGHAFWTYIDRPSDYLAAGGGKLFRSYKEVMRQLFAAINQGDLTNIKKFVFYPPQDLAGESLFGRRHRHKKAGKFVLQSQNYDAVAQKIYTHMEKYQSGLLICASIDEANQMTELLNKIAQGKKKFVTFHSKMGLTPQESQEFLETFRNSDNSFIVSVNKLDEGIDIPKMQIYVDLNRTLYIRQFIQRMGRILRLSPNKREVEIVLFLEKFNGPAEDQLELMNYIVGHINKDGSTEELMKQRQLEDQHQQTKMLSNVFDNNDGSGEMELLFLKKLEMIVRENLFNQDPLFWYDQLFLRSINIQQQGRLIDIRPKIGQLFTASQNSSLSYHLDEVVEQKIGAIKDQILDDKGIVRALANLDNYLLENKESILSLNLPILPKHDVALVNSLRQHGIDESNLYQYLDYLPFGASTLRRVFWAQGVDDVQLATIHNLNQKIFERQHDRDYLHWAKYFLRDLDYFYYANNLESTNSFEELSVFLRVDNPLQLKQTLRMARRHIEHLNFYFTFIDRLKEINDKVRVVSPLKWINQDQSISDSIVKMGIDLNDMDYFLQISPPSYHSLIVDAFHQRTKKYQYLGQRLFGNPDLEERYRIVFNFLVEIETSGHLYLLKSWNDLLYHFGEISTLMSMSGILKNNIKQIYQDRLNEEELQKLNEIIDYFDFKIDAFKKIRKHEQRKNQNGLKVPTKEQELINKPFNQVQKANPTLVREVAEQLAFFLEVSKPKTWRTVFAYKALKKRLDLIPINGNNYREFSEYFTPEILAQLDQLKR